MVGIDEVGRGAWAGPLLVVAARQTGSKAVKLRDSKLLSMIQREKAFANIQSNFDIGEGWVDVEEIDRYGLGKAMRLGVSRALLSLRAGYDEHIVMDGKVNYCDRRYVNTSCIVKADAIISCVSAASIHAKVTRDKWMKNISLLYPQYNFEKNVGYGTDKHKRALKEHGITPLHRQSFKPIKAFI